MSSNDAISRMEELLDRLGMEYWWDSDILYWDGSDGVPWTAMRRVDGDLNLYSPHCTFKQAVAATLGNDGLERSKNGVGRSKNEVAEYTDPSSFDYAIEQLREFRWQHATNDEDAIPYINNVAAAHERENTRLREQIEVFFDAMHKSATATRKLQAENDKLRKLCELAFTCIEQGEDEYGSDWSCAGCEFCDKCDGLIQARATAQELGVEVGA